MHRKFAHRRTKEEERSNTDNATACAAGVAAAALQLEVVAVSHKRFCLRESATLQDKHKKSAHTREKTSGHEKSSRGAQSWDWKCGAAASLRGSLTQHADPGDSRRHPVSQAHARCLRVTPLCVRMCAMKSGPLNSAASCPPPPKRENLQASRRPPCVCLRLVQQALLPCNDMPSVSCASRSLHRPFIARHQHGPHLRVPNGGCCSFPFVFYRLCLLRWF